MIMRQGRKG
jgi:hypothetical protein